MGLISCVPHDSLYHPHLIDKETEARVCVCDLATVTKSLGGCLWGSDPILVVRQSFFNSLCLEEDLFPALRVEAGVTF